MIEAMIWEWLNDKNENLTAKKSIEGKGVGGFQYPTAIVVVLRYLHQLTFITLYVGIC